jgi:prolyl oligopeptidase
VHRPSARNVVTDTYHGVQVSEPYRWLEDSADPKVHDWSVAEDKRTRQYLDALPQRDRLAAASQEMRLRELRPEF